MFKEELNVEDKPLEKDEYIMTVRVRDYDKQLIKLIAYIRALAGPGHSFVVDVDPDMRENSKKFSMDGDGSFNIQSIKMNGVEVSLQDNKLIVKESLWMEKQS